MTGLSPAERDALERAFLIGLGRQLLPVPSLVAGAAEAENIALLCLGLLAQRRRFDRPGPVPPAPEAPRVLREDGRAILDTDTGRLLQRLLESGSMRAAAPLLEAAVARMAASGLRPHPFQVRKMTAILKKQGCSFGEKERAYLAAIDPVMNPDDPVVADGQVAIDSGNWTSFPRQRRVDCIAAMRLRDPPAARALVESCLAAEPANVRADLVGALAAGISADDREFLEGLATDRAQTVREAAARLLSLIPGTPAHGERLAKATAAVQVSSEGLVFRKKVLVPVDKSATVTHFHRLFESLTIEALAERFAVSATDLVAMVSPASEALLLALAQVAVRTGRLDLFAILLTAAQSSGWSWTRFTSLLGADLAGVPGSSRAPMIAALAPFGSDPFPRAVDWRALAALCGGPLPPDLADPIIRSPGWHALMESLRDEKSPRRYEADADLAAFAAMLPASVLPRLGDALAVALLAIAGVIGAYATFVAALESRAAAGASL